MKILGSTITLPVWFGQLRQFYTVIAGILITMAIKMPVWLESLITLDGTNYVFALLGAAIMLYQHIKSANAVEKTVIAKRLSGEGVNVNPVWLGQIRHIMTLIGTILVSFSINVPDFVSAFFSESAIQGLSAIVGSVLVWLSSLSSANDPAKTALGEITLKEYQNLKAAA